MDNKSKDTSDMQTYPERGNYNNRNNGNNYNNRGGYNNRSNRGGYNNRYNNRGFRNGYNNRNNIHKKRGEYNEHYTNEKEQEHDNVNSTHKQVQEHEPVNIGNMVRETDNLPECIDDFEDMKLEDNLYMGLHEYGFKHPSPIQSRTIHIIKNGADLIAQSQSGTGKTGAFTIGSLANIDPTLCYPQVIIVANTKDLASQIMKVTESLAKYMDIKLCLCVGGHKNTPAVNARMATDSHVLIGTPGRLGDLLENQAFDGKKIRTLIMDETDALLKDDFKEQIVKIIQCVGKHTQICVFSATFTRETLETSMKFLRDPYRITVEREQVSLDKVIQYKIELKYDKHKLHTLLDLYSQLNISQMIIFVNSINNAEYLRDKLMDKGIEAGLVHGKMGSVDRENVLKEFRLTYIKTLITTDVMCRGIDIDNLKMVINYDMAKDPDTYIHRVGRSGRYGGQGVAINFCTFNDIAILKSLSRNYNINITDMPEPHIINEYLTGMVDPTDKVYSSKMYQ